MVSLIEMVWPCKKDGRRKESKEIVEIRVEGRHGYGRLYITWEDSIKNLRQKHGRAIAEIKRTKEDKSD